MRVVAVVGSFGKTTTVSAVRAALGLPVPAQGGGSHASMARELLAKLPWHPPVVFEVAIDRPGQMGPCAAMLRPDVTVVTTIGTEHHRSLGTLETTQAEKGRMVQALRRDGVAVLNADDPRVLAMAATTEARIVTYGFDPAADVRGSDVEIAWPHGTRLSVHAGGERRSLQLRLLGRVMARPALAAIAVAVAEGRSLDDAIAGLERLEPRRMRMQIVALPGDAWMIRDEFKSSLETIDAALDTFARCPGARSSSPGRCRSPRAARDRSTAASGSGWGKSRHG
ncbi:MAG: Mur ligase family protein [Geminicoccaceae bacterium]